MAQATTAMQIHSKRQTTSLASLRRRQEAGEDVSEMRAFVRLSRGNTRFMLGMDDVSEWDDEELARGYRKAADGSFKGQPPTLIPRVVHQEITRRNMEKAMILLRDNLTAAVDMLTKIAVDPSVEAKDRIKAIEIIMDRVMGKSVDKVEVTTEQPAWAVALQGAIVSIKQEQVIDTTATEPDSDDEEDPFSE